METILNSLKSKQILCIGDVMLDRFTYGDVTRVSPEAPVPVLNFSHSKDMPGGIGNVVCNLNDMGCRVTLLSVVGDDDNAARLNDIFNSYKNVSAHFVTDPSRPTTTKERFATDTQHIVRVDREKTHPIDDDIESKILKDFIKNLKKSDGVILSDYKKGVLTDTLIKTVIAEAAKLDIPVFVDPKGQDFKRYRGAFALTPNYKELLGTSDHTDPAIIAKNLMKETGIRSLVVTMAEKGVMVFEADGKDPVHHKATARHVKDVSGAGDTFIAGLAAAVSTGAPLAEAAFFANHAAGLTVEKQGTTTITHEELTARIGATATHHRQTFAPIVDKETAQAIIHQWKQDGLTVGFTNGCFDIIHQGHVVYLDKARQHCDKMILGLNVDESITRLKGVGRPVNHFEARANVMAALGSIDLVVPFAEKCSENDTPLELITALIPDMLFKGADYTVDTVVGADVVMQNGGKVVLVELEDGFSTTDTIKKLSAA